MHPLRNALLITILAFLGSIQPFLSTAQICNKSQLPANLQNGLVAFYPFCGNANDASGNGNNGTVNGATLTTDRFGVANSAYSFNGSSNYISVPNSPTNSIQTNFSASVWILMDGGGCNPRVFEINENVNSCGGYVLAVNGTSNISRTIHACAFSSCAGGVGIAPTNTISSLQWHHLAFTVDGIAGTGKFYLDGQLVQTSNGAPVPAFSYNGNSLTIGNINSGRCDWWGGKIDDLLFYNRVLGDCEIAQLYSATANNVPVNQSFLINILADTTRACGTPGTLDAGSGYTSYRWNTGATTRIITPLSSGHYSVTVTNAAGCSATDSTYLSVVTANITQADTTVCSTGPLVLTVDTILPALRNRFTYLGTAASRKFYISNAVHSWFEARDSAFLFGGRLGILNSIQKDTLVSNLLVRMAQTSTFPLSPTAGSAWLGLYQDTLSPVYSEPAGGWKWINEDPLVYSNWQAPPEPNNNSVLSNYAETNWNNNTGRWNDKGPGLLPYNAYSNPLRYIFEVERTLPLSIQWSTGASTSSITVNPSQTTTYYVTVSDGINTYTDSVTVTVNNLSNFNPLSDTTRVCGTTTTLDAGSGFASYSWSNGATTQSITPTTGGFYKVTVTNAAGCSTSDSTWLSLVKANILQNDTTVCRRSPIVLSVDSLYTALYAVGSKTRSGGYVFNDKGSLSNGWRYMEVTPGEQSTSGNGIGCYCTTISGSADSVGAGVLNTQNLVNLNCGSWSALTTTFRQNGFGNWFIPSKDELNLVYQRLKQNGIGNFLNQPYWTSSPGSYGSCGINGGAWVQNFLNGVQYSDIRNGYAGAGNLRLVRRVSGQERYRITWSTGDTAAQILVLPNQTTTYYVTVSDGVHSCTDSIWVTVAQPDTSILALDPPQVCSNGGQVRLQAGIASSYQWLRNNVPIPGALARVYAATQSGSYRVLVTNALNCRDTSRSISVSINPRPVVGFTVNNGSQCAQTNYFVFSNNSSITSGSLTYFWRFGDGSTANSATAAHSYAAPGNYTVTLIATSDLGCVDSISQTVVVSSSPNVSFNIVGAAQQCLNGNAFQFNSTSTISTGTLTASWSFGDGNVASGLNVSHSYLTPGTYTVKLVIISNAGCSDSSTRTVVVHPKPQVGFQVNSASQCFNGNNFQFTNTSGILAGFMTYDWTFGNGVGSQSANTNYSYPAVGTYTVKLVATSNLGCKDSSSQQMQVTPSPTAAFSVNNDIQCLAGNQFVFTNGSTVSGGNLAYTWNFGNGVGSSTSQNPSYTYPAAGSYLVTLDVNTPFNCSARVSRTVIVRPMPVGNLNTPANTVLCEGGSITLTASGGDSYQWFLNGGLINGAISATYSATQPGVYTVNLINSFGCTTLAANTVTLSQVLKPVVDFRYDSYCLNRSVQFTDMTNTAVTGPVTRLWDFGNGGSSTLANPQYTYTVSGTYTVSLRVTPTACPNLSTTATKVITLESPATSIRYPSLNAVSGQNLPLLARSFNNAQYNWSPATSLSNASLRNPVFNGSAGQTYLIRITTPAGCEVVDTQQVRVFTERNIYLPDVFSPNGDGKNDRLTPILIGISQLRFFRVYDRWGQIVFQTSRTGDGWDGWFRGVKQPMETYTWVAEGVDLEGNTIRKTGSSILIR